MKAKEKPFWNLLGEFVFFSGNFKKIFASWLLTRYSKNLSFICLAGFFMNKVTKPSKIMISKSFRHFQFEIIIFQYFDPNVGRKNILKMNNNVSLIFATQEYSWLCPWHRTYINKHIFVFGDMYLFDEYSIHKLHLDQNIDI